MEILKKKQLAIMSFAIVAMLPALTSCDKDEINPAPTITHQASQSEAVTATSRVVEIKSVNLGATQLKQIQESLKGIDPSLYRMEIQQGGKVTSRMGSAAITDLQKVGAYYSKEFGRVIAANEIVTTVSDYIKTVWTAKLLQDIRYKEQLARVQTILNQATVKNVTLQPVKLSASELKQIQQTLKGIDPALYRFEIQQAGKVTSRMGSAAITDLQKVGAYYSKDFGRATAANEIVTTVSDYIKTVWTAKLLQDIRYKEQLAKVESILNQAAMR